MQKNNVSGKEEYNPRWFIWTIVFLVVTGVSLVAFIVLSGNEYEYQGTVPIHRQAKQVSQNK